MAVTTTSFPRALLASRFRAEGSTFATCAPCGSISEGRSPASSVTAAMGRSFAAWAISSELRMQGG